MRRVVGVMGRGEWEGWEEEEEEESGRNGKPSGGSLYAGNVAPG